MFITTLKRILRNGLKVFWRNGFLTTSSILTLTLTLSVASFLFFASILSQSVLNRIGNKVDINIYFTPETSIEKAGAFKQEIFEKLDFVDREKSKLLSKEDALIQWKKIEGDKTVDDLLDILGENPLGPVLNIKAKDINNYEDIIEFIETAKIQAKYSDIINDTNYNKNKQIIRKIKIWMKYLKIIGFGIFVVVLSISFILIYNIIRIVTFAYKDEIQVMKLMGASNFFIRGPYLISGILYGMISGLLTFSLTWAAIHYSQDVLKKLFVLNLEEYFKHNIWQILGGFLITGIVIGFISTYFAVSKFLKIKED